jgi:hypothetical protein
LPKELPRRLPSEAFREKEALRSLGRMLEIFVLSGSTAWPSRVVGREAALEEKMEVENMGAPAELGVLGAMAGLGSGLVICLVARSRAFKESEGCGSG